MWEEWEISTPPEKAAEPPEGAVLLGLLTVVGSLALIALGFFLGLLSR